MVNYLNAKMSQFLSILSLQCQPLIRASAVKVPIKIYIHCSVHRGSILIRSNEMQQYADVYLLQNYSTCFGCPSHPSSVVHQTAIAASGTGHSNNIATTFRQRGLIRPHWRKVVALTLWPVPEATVAVLCTPDDGCDGRPKHIGLILQ